MLPARITRGRHVADFYSVLSQGVAALEQNTSPARAGVYEKARQALIGHLLSASPPLSDAEIEAQTSALEAAIERVERDHTTTATAVLQEPVASESTAVDDVPSAEPSLDRDGTQPRRRRRSLLLVVLAVIAVTLAGIAGYAYWTGRLGNAVRVMEDTGRNIFSGAAVKRTDAPPAEDGEVEPGIDGGSSEAGLSYVYRRQPVYYRTTHPVGTVIVDPLQRFLYLIQPNVVALRYGIGVGRECRDMLGLLRIVRKEEWPAWFPSAESIEAKSYPSHMPGGPGNPLGARALYLGRDARLIHGTNAPKSIGQLLARGCFRLVNDDVVDLYGRVPLGTAVVVIN
jgi:lipoprotein-anchoring transpeptidase ErfK/SrfK